MARVLVVDDTEIVRVALEVAIRRMGHESVAAADGRTAIALALEIPPDLALIDMRMPDMDGAELFREMRARLAGRCPPVLFVSATPAEEVAPRVEPIGPVAGYVKKPFQLDDLVRTIADVLAAPAQARLGARGARPPADR